MAVICVTKTSGDTTALISSNTTKDTKCKWGEVLPKKDDCNACICYEGEVHCTNLPCDIKQRMDGTPECEVGQPWIKLDECNSCFCDDGKLECSDYICIRGNYMEIVS
ncbi:kielin/chordin-like protein [Trichoplusia ni]|uniref:Kielin/chordin-like protein n=1 Tax=Trichoplusia ni TaxID=7111 RepID=A0A7E5W7W4_TRINI|nr:kielin/chordin-like protein [Trichoplusia ni]